jgi:hypothetical protein
MKKVVWLPNKKMIVHNVRKSTTWGSQGMKYTYLRKKVAYSFPKNSKALSIVCALF